MRVISKTYKYEEFKFLNKKKTTIFLKWAKSLKRYFSKEDTPMVKRCKKNAQYIIIRERQIKITVRYYLTFMSLAIIK